MPVWGYRDVQPKGNLPQKPRYRTFTKNIKVVKKMLTFVYLCGIIIMFATGWIKIFKKILKILRKILIF